MARRESRITKWQARPHAQGRRSRSSNKEPIKEWPITLDSPKQHDKALAWRRLFSEPLARPLSTPGLNLLGLEAQPHRPIQQHVSTVDSTPLCDTCHSRQSTDRSQTLCPAWQILLSCALHRQLPLPLSSLFSSSRHAPAVLVSTETSATRCSLPDFAREPVAQGCRQRPREFCAGIAGERVRVGRLPLRSSLSKVTRRTTYNVPARSVTSVSSSMHSTATLLVRMQRVQCDPNLMFTFDIRIALRERITGDRPIKHSTDPSRIW